MIKHARIRRSGFLRHTAAEDLKLRKDPAFGGPCFEGTLQNASGKPAASESNPVAGKIESDTLSENLDAGQRRELQKISG